MIRNTLLSLFVILAASTVEAQEQPPLFASAEEAAQARGDEGTEEADKALNEKLDIQVRAEFVAEKIRFNKRQLDPFGFPMDPSNIVESMALSDQFEDLEESPVINNSTLTNALQTIQMTGIYPQKQTIVIGARVFKAGDVFGMKLEELVIRLRFEGVKGSNVYFKDLDTQEVAYVEFNTRPATFEPITASSKPQIGEGIVPMNDLYIVN